MIKRARVLIVFYDLPVTDSGVSRKAARFRKELKRAGFVQVQKSVYAKMIHNRMNAENEIADVRAFAPVEGEINMLCMSLNEFKNMVVIAGDKFDMGLFADEIVEI